MRLTCKVKIDYNSNSPTINGDTEELYDIT